MNSSGLDRLINSKAERVKKHSLTPEGVIDVYLHTNSKIWYRSERNGTVHSRELDEWELISSDLSDKQLQPYFDVGLVDARVTTKQQLKKEKPMNADQWKFQVPSPKAINYTDIYKGMSYKNPIVMLEAEERKTVIVLVDLSIWEKTQFCVGGKKLQDDLQRLICADWIPKDRVAKIVKLVKKIRAAPYKKSYQEKLTCTAISLKV